MKKHWILNATMEPQGDRILATVTLNAGQIKKFYFIDGKWCTHKGLPVTKDTDETLNEVKAQIDTNGNPFLQPENYRLEN